MQAEQVRQVVPEVEVTRLITRKLAALPKETAGSAIRLKRTRVFITDVIVG